MKTLKISKSMQRALTILGHQGGASLSWAECHYLRISVQTARALRKRGLINMVDGGNQNWSISPKKKV